MVLRGKVVQTVKAVAKKRPEPLAKIAGVISQYELLLKDHTPMWTGALRWAGWPDWVEFLAPNNIARSNQERNDHRRRPLEWLHHWYGHITHEAEIAQKELRSVLGIRCVWADAQKSVRAPSGKLSALLLWDIRACQYLNNKEICDALNEMNYRLGYNDYFLYSKDPQRVYSPG